MLIGAGGLVVLAGLAAPVQALQQRPAPVKPVTAAQVSVASGRFAAWHEELQVRQTQRREARQVARKRKAAQRKKNVKRSRQRRWVTDPAGDAPRADRDIRRVRLTRTPEGFTATFTLAGAPEGHASYFVDLYRPGGKVRLEALRKESGYVDLDSYDPARRPAFVTDDRASHRTQGRKVTLFWPGKLAGSGWNGRWSAQITSSAGGDSTLPVKYVHASR